MRFILTELNVVLPPSSPPLKPNSLEQEPGGISDLFQTRQEEISGEACDFISLDKNSVSGICLWAVQSCGGPLSVREVEVVTAVSLGVFT